MRLPWCGTSSIRSRSASPKQRLCLGLLHRVRCRRSAARSVRRSAAMRSTQERCSGEPPPRRHRLPRADAAPEAHAVHTQVCPAGAGRAARGPQRVIGRACFDRACVRQCQPAAPRAADVWSRSRWLSTSRSSSMARPARTQQRQQHTSLAHRSREYWRPVVVDQQVLARAHQHGLAPGPRRARSASNCPGCCGRSSRPGRGSSSGKARQTHVQAGSVSSTAAPRLPAPGPQRGAAWDSRPRPAVPAALQQHRQRCIAHARPHNGAHSGPRPSASGVTTSDGPRNRYTRLAGKPTRRRFLAKQQQGPMASRQRHHPLFTQNA